MAKPQVGRVGSDWVGLCRVDQVEQVDRVGQVDRVEQVAPALTRRVRAEFLEMPGLTVTFWQAMRLWNLDERVCRAVLDVLVQGGFLTETRQGAFRRVGR